MSAALDRATGQQPTFSGRVDGDCPPGFHRVLRSRRVGSGSADFQRAAEVVLSWQMLQRAGMRVEATSDRAELGATIVQRLGPMRAPCRIVAVFDETRRGGFSYASLPGHPENGVEQFLVEHRDDDAVWCVISSISRSAAWYAKLGGPVTRFVQARMVGRYLAAVAG